MAISVGKRHLQEQEERNERKKISKICIKSGKAENTHDKFYMNKHAIRCD